MIYDNFKAKNMRCQAKIKKNYKFLLNSLT